jgi:uncharacterized protein
VLAFQAELIEPSTFNDPDLRDANHQPILATLLTAQANAGADYLITGDKDLLALANRYPIVEPAQFWAAHAGL